MKAVVHIGMHKTGTSSIQESFAAKAPSGTAYFHLAGPNLNAWSRIMFEEPDAIRQLRYLRSADDAQLDRERVATAAKSAEALEHLDADTVILSAERFTYMSPAAVEGFRDWLRRHFDEIAIHAYVRDPMSFIRSSFQQRAKTLSNLQSFVPDYPDYRGRFEKYETLFGTEAVHYRLFRRAGLHQGDVVTDFASWLGSDYALPDVIHANESLSAEALACLVAAFRGMDARRDRKDAVLINGALIQALTTHKGRSWSLSARKQSSVLAAIGADCDWMDLRLPSPLLREDPPADIEITEVGDFLPLALESFVELRAHVVTTLLGSGTPTGSPLVGDLELLSLMGRP